MFALYSNRALSTLLSQDTIELKYRKKKEFIKVINDATIAIKYDPTNSMIYFIRGSAYHATKQAIKATGDYQMACNIQSGGKVYKNKCYIL